MLAEALVIFACVNNSGCTETSNLYFSQNPGTKHYLEVEGEEARQFLGPRLVDDMGPILFFIGGGTSTIRLSDHLSLQGSTSNAILSWNWIL